MLILAGRRWRADRDRRARRRRFNDLRAGIEAACRTRAIRSAAGFEVRPALSTGRSAQA
jgi:hypothetical protein